MLSARIVTACTGPLETFRPKKGPPGPLEHRLILQPPGVLGMLQGSALALPLADDSVDASLVMRFLFHLDDADERIAVLRELARVTRGPLLGQVRTRHSLKHMGRYLRHQVGLSRRYRPSQEPAAVQQELSAAGLRLIAWQPLSRVFSDKALFLASKG